MCFFVCSFSQGAAGYVSEPLQIHKAQEDQSVRGHLER